MASRPFETEYRASNGMISSRNPLMARGHSASPEGAILAATKRLLKGDYRRADIKGLDGGVRVTIIRKADELVMTGRGLKSP